MKPHLLFIGIGLILLAFTGKPEIQWRPSSINLGKVQQGDTLRGTFTYVNHSHSGFVIENILASCGCVVPVWSKDTLAPGDSASINVAFDTHGKSKEHTKTITVYSSHGLYELILTADIHKN